MFCKTLKSSAYFSKKILKLRRHRIKKTNYIKRNKMYPSFIFSKFKYTIDDVFDKTVDNAIAPSCGIDVFPKFKDVILVFVSSISDNA